MITKIDIIWKFARERIKNITKVTQSLHLSGFL
jgi:hypothetical protein